MNSENSDINLGIDVSKYQKGLDFSAIKAAGIAHVCIQITEGTSYINPHWQQHYQNAKAQGLNIGFYHSFTPGVNAAAQAQYFFQAISGIPYDCLPMVYMERDSRFETEELIGEVHACVNEIAYLTGYMTIIYTSTSFAANNLNANYVDMYPLWEAEYNTWGYPGTNFA